VLDAGDIIQTLAGWSVIGHGKTRIPRIRFLGENKLHFREKATETQKGAQAMDEAIGELSLKCNATDARRALYLLTAPPEEMNMELKKKTLDRHLINKIIVAAMVPILTYGVKIFLGPVLAL